MTHLRKMMLEELQRRNYSQHTTRCYIRTVEDFDRRFNCPPDRLVPRHIREYQAELFQKRKLSPGSVARYLAALRFFYTKTLKKAWSIAETPYPKRAFHLPSILNEEEVAQLIDAALTPYHRILLMTLYATGARNAEYSPKHPMKESHFVVVGHDIYHEILRHCLHATTLPKCEVTEARLRSLSLRNC